MAQIYCKSFHTTYIHINKIEFEFPKIFSVIFLFMKVDRVMEVALLYMHTGNSAIYMIGASW